MPGIDYSKALGFAAQSSTGIIKPTSKDKDANGKIDENALLDSATSSNPIPVVVDDKAPIADFLMTEQSTRQLYVIQSRTDKNGKVTEVYLARKDENGVMTGVDWCSVEYVTCGNIADATIIVPSKQPVQNDPKTTPTINNTKTEEKESYVFFDPYLFADRRADIIHDDGTTSPYPGLGKIVNNDMECAIGIQRGVAQYMGKYDGKKKISNDVQNEINKWVHLIPFSSIPDSDYPDIKYKNCIEDSGLDGKVQTFIDFINNKVSTKNVDVIAIWAHANATLFDLCDVAHDYFRIGRIADLKLPNLNMILLLGCNMGVLTNLNNFANELSKLVKVEKTVIAGDGFISTSKIEESLGWISKETHVVNSKHWINNVKGGTYENNTSVGFVLYSNGSDTGHRIYGAAAYKIGDGRTSSQILSESDSLLT